MNPHPDHKYIEALAKNDSVLIEEIYRRYSAGIRRMVLKNSGSESDAADLFQEVLVELHRKAISQQFVLTCPFEAFLHLVCRNRWINELHKRKGITVTIDDDRGLDLSGDAATNYELLCKQENRRTLVQEKLAGLGDGCRDLLSLSWSGKPMQEVARLLNFSYAYVRKKKTECMAKLINLVKNDPGYDALKW
ncbi:MAG TPA: sigma-70 family RNA polymerase sigma factor [Ferruginibacter sp.]|nr:sigma-70 family RNA polymerase sigma factor [Ferruginibacter sp.]HNN72693.1 sigma-70 family RNA polymerase sigma factor [Ferruginibacter sp.]